MASITDRPASVSSDVGISGAARRVPTDADSPRRPGLRRRQLDRRAISDSPSRSTPSSSRWRRP